MDDAVAAVLAHYAEREARELLEWQSRPADELRGRIDEFLISVGPAAGQFLNLLVRERRARTILELGTCYGHSTVWLAEAARATGGIVHTTELSAAKIAYARDQVTRAGLGDHVRFHEGDARSTIAGLDLAFDFVLVDLWKDLYLPCFELFHPKLAPGALVAADNMTDPVDNRALAFAYRRHVRSLPDMESVLVDIGNGIELSRCTRGLDPYLIDPA